MRPCSNACAARLLLLLLLLLQKELQSQVNLMMATVCQMGHLSCTV